MLRRPRPRLSYANVMATTAVFIALGGTSYAALTVTSRHVKNNSLKSADIKNNSIRSRDVKNRSLLAKDFRPDQIPASAPGPQGAKGESGPRGPQGASGATHVTTRSSSGTTLAPGASFESDTYCEPGERALGGGGNLTAMESHPGVLTRRGTGEPYAAEPVDGQIADSWHYVGRNDSGSPQALRGYVICIAK